MTIDFDKLGGLVPAIIQDDATLKVLMLGFMNKEAYEKTVATGKVTFFSRTRNKLWTKGETSGNFLNLVSIKNDCDNDTLLIRVNPVGPVCHTGTDTCWGEVNEGGMTALEAVQRKIKADVADPSTYAGKNHAEGKNRVAQNLGEEAVVAVIKASKGSREEIIEQSGSLLYHLLEMLTENGIDINEIKKIAQKD